VKSTSVVGFWGCRLRHSFRIRFRGLKASAPLKVTHKRRRPLSFAARLSCLRVARRAIDAPSGFQGLCSQREKQLQIFRLRPPRRTSLKMTAAGWGGVMTVAGWGGVMTVAEWGGAMTAVERGGGDIPTLRQGRVARIEHPAFPGFTSARADFTLRNCRPILRSGKEEHFPRFSFSSAGRRPINILDGFFDSAARTRRFGLVVIAYVDSRGCPAPRKRNGHLLRQPRAEEEPWLEKWRCSCLQSLRF